MFAHSFSFLVSRLIIVLPFLLIVFAVDVFSTSFVYAFPIVFFVVVCSLFFIHRLYICCVCLCVCVGLLFFFNFASSFHLV